MQQKKLLQSDTRVIIKCIIYYKVGQVMQSGAITIKCDNADIFANINHNN